MRLVIAEDELLLREGMAEVLTQKGLDVVGLAGDGAELVRTHRLMLRPCAPSEDRLFTSPESNASASAAGLARCPRVSPLPALRTADEK